MKECLFAIVICMTSYSQCGGYVLTPPEIEVVKIGQVVLGFHDSTFEKAALKNRLREIFPEGKSMSDGLRLILAGTLRLSGNQRCQITFDANQVIVAFVLKEDRGSSDWFKCYIEMVHGKTREMTFVTGVDIY